MKKLLKIFFGEYCKKHDRFFHSDLCPYCVKQRVIDQEVHDARKEWIKAEGSWPLRGRINDRSTD